MTFDNVPWVITMKKNDHYFPTTEWIKDPTSPDAQSSGGWRRVTYEQGKKIDGEGTEGINVVSGGDTYDDGDAVGELQG